MNRRFWTIGLILVLWSSAKGETQSDALCAELRRSCALLGKLPGIVLNATSEFSYGQKFLEANPRISAPHRSNVEEYTVKTTGNMFRIGVDFHSKVGKNEVGYVRMFDGENTMYRYANESTFLRMKKGAALTPDNSAPLGSVLFIPYGFLFPTTEPDKLSVVTQSMFAEGGLWEKLKQNISVSPSVDESGSSIKVQRADGSYFVVEMDTVYPLFPKKFRLFGNDGKLLLTYETLEIGKLSVPGDVTVPFAKKFVYTRYVDGYLISERKVSVGRVQFGTLNKEDDFSYDITSAAHILDEDSNKLIIVPK